MADWQITWNGNTWTDDDLTGAHIALIMGLQGVDSWEFCNPLAGPLKLLGVLAAFVSLAEQRVVGEVMQELTQARAIELLDAISIPEPDADEDADVDDGPDGGVAAVVHAPPKQPAPGKQRVRV